MDLEEVKEPGTAPIPVPHQGLIHPDHPDKLEIFDLDDLNVIDEVVHDKDLSPPSPPELQLPLQDENVASRTRSKKASKVLPMVNSATVSQSPSLNQLTQLVPTVLLFILMTPLLKDPVIASRSVAAGSGPLNLGGVENKSFEKRFKNFTREDLKQLKYVQAVDFVTDRDVDPDDAMIWDVKLIECHRWRKKGVEVKCRWNDPNHETSWVNLFALALQDPTPVLKYAQHLHILDQYPFKCLVAYCSGDTPSSLIRAFKAKVTPSAPKFKFGVRVPYGVKQALYLDKVNGNHHWRDAIKKELEQLTEFKVFRTLAKGEVLDPEYKQIPYHIVFDVKFDLRCKARLVADGNWTDLICGDVYSGVVSIETVRIGFLIGELNNLQCCAGDVGNAFLNGYTKEKIYIIAGPEFGPDLEGQILVIVRSLYGLRTSAACFHEQLSEVLSILGFKPTKMDPNLFYADMEDHYDYVASYVDDVLVWSKDPMAVIKKLEDIYTMKGVGIPEYYLGGNVDYLDEHWTKENVGLATSAKTCIENTIPKFEKLFDTKFKSIKTPMEADYHPELDDSPLLSPLDASKYRSIIGSLNWIITLGRFDIQYSTMSLSRFSVAPREGHLKAAQRILGYLKVFYKGRIIMDNSYPDHSQYPTEDHENWKEFYPDAQEDIPHDALPPKGKPVRLTVYVDADHAHDQVTRRSVTGIVAFINNTPVRWISKRQKTVETSTYGSELVAARIATELIMELRYNLRMMGVPIEGPALLLGDNMSVVLNTTVPSSVLKKKHLAVGYHRVREAIACGILRFAHIRSENNIADVLTKPLTNVKFHPLIQPILFRSPLHTSKPT